MELSNVISLLEEGSFAYSLHSIPKAKQNCLESIKVLNTISKLTGANDVSNVLSKYSMTLYDAINAKNDFYSYNEKFKWLSSKINGNFFPPVVSFGPGVSSHNMNFIPSNRVDKVQLDLPPKFVNEFEFQICSPLHVIDNSPEGDVELENLYQDLLTNCSFVCAMLSLVFVNPELIKSRLICNESNSIAKLHVNGCDRLIVINNELPIIKEGSSLGSNRSLVIRSSRPNSKLWRPALLEKAYLTLMGQGYNFKGSNMALDVYMLVGWVPEVIRIQNGQLPSAISRILDDNSKDIVMGLGVGSISESFSKSVGLISEHDYSIIGTRINSGLREFNIRNPWNKNASSDSAWWIDENQLQHFNYLYINYNSENLFKFKEEINLVKLPKNTLWNSLYDKPQVGITFSSEDSTSKSVSVWLLLERHLPSKLSTAEEKDDSVVINLSVYKSGTGEKLLTTTQYPYVYKPSVGTNNRTFLAKLDNLEINSSADSYTIVIDSTAASNFTLKAFSNSAFSFYKSKPKYKKILPIIEDEWSLNITGGNLTKSTFIYNPQYNLEVSEESNISIGVFGESANYYYNFHVFSCNDLHAPLVEILSPSNLIRQENYKMGAVLMNFDDIKPGNYRIVFSTYEVLESNKPLNFKIYVNTDAESDSIRLSKYHVTLSLFLARKQLIPWHNSNRIKVNFRTTSTNSKVKFHIQYTNATDFTGSTASNGRFQNDISDYRPALRASIFSSVTHESVLVNENWSNSLYGIFVEVNLAGISEYILLIERFESGIGGCVIDCGSSRKIEYI
ncbi:calpain-like protease palB/RIM13 [[Candida] railenensis]|uniref:Cysteine protease RIM13 n=1 Tax=[Candida] railenensis TaxID=45579 RepID=A0A9P0QS76_9ASCO|nr:calpain-like protease palB/RIM13 [[Candida] railenensis]